MPWYPPRPVPDNLRNLALAALAYGLEVYCDDESNGLELRVGHPDLRVYQTIITLDQLEAFVATWVRGVPAAD